MGRKNDRARQRNIKGRLDRRPKGQIRSPRPEIPRVPVEKIILPDGQCFYGGRNKARFGTKEKAEAALAQAKKQRERTGSLHVEKRVYRCDRCDGWHLTSREQFERR